MNNTFMFGEDRFSAAEDYYAFYQTTTGKLSRARVNQTIAEVYAYLDARYPDPAYRECFPSVESALISLYGDGLNKTERACLIHTFAHHELGTIPQKYCHALNDLASRFRLGLVVDIWSPKLAWERYFHQIGIQKLLKISSFSSDHGVVKPSSWPFLQVLGKLEVDRCQALVVGDSLRRDLGGARAAGLDCVLVGGAQHPHALASYEDLLAFRDAVCAPTLQA